MQPGDARRGKFADNLTGFGRSLRRAGIPVDSVTAIGNKVMWVATICNDGPNQLVHFLIGLDGFHRGSPYSLRTKLRSRKAHGVSLPVYRLNKYRVIWTNLPKIPVS